MQKEVSGQKVSTKVSRVCGRVDDSTPHVGVTPLGKLTSTGQCWQHTKVGRQGCMGAEGGLGKGISFLPEETGGETVNRVNMAYSSSSSR